MTPPLPQPVSGSAIRADTGRERASMSATGPFVINLCSSTTPMALEQPKLGELKQRFTFFVSRRREDGRERFRLHMGYFETENEAEEWLAVVRDIYPGAWTGEAPGKRLREREAAAAAAGIPVTNKGQLPTPTTISNFSANLSANIPAGPQPPAYVLAGIAKLQATDAKLRTPPAAAALDARRNELSATFEPRRPEPAPAAAQTEFSVTFDTAPSPPSAPAFTVPKPDLAPIMLAPPLPASAPDAARSALVAASASAQAAVRMASPPPVLVVPTLQEAPPELPPFASIPVLNAPTLSAPVLNPPVAASAALTASTAANLAETVQPAVALSAPKIAPPVFAPPSAPVAKPAAPAPRAAAPVAKSTAPVAKPATPVGKPQAPVMPVAKQAAKAAPPAVAKSSGKVRPAAPVQPVQPKASTDALSNVAEVLASLDETGQTRQMPVLPSQAALIKQTVVSSPAASNGNPSMSDTQVLKYLENRRADGGVHTGPESDDGISMLRPDDTGTVRALKEAVTTNQPVSFAVQLKWSVQPIELSDVPPLAIFSAYTLYTVEGSREGRKWFGLRLGFFTDAISAKQVAYYVRSEFASVAVVPVSPQERSRATDAGKNSAIARPSSAPPPRKPAPVDEFKLIDTMETRALPTPAPAARPAVAAPAPKPQPKAPPVAKQKAKTPGKVRARDKRTPQSLEETLEILGADQLEIDNGRGELLNDTGVRHLKVSVQKNSPFSRLLDRLSERVNKS
jgi:hypothetical protein